MSKQKAIGLTVLSLAVPAVVSIAATAVPGMVGYGRLQSQAAAAQRTADAADVKAQKAQDDAARLPALIQAEFRKHEQAEQPLRDDVASIRSMLKTHMAAGRLKPNE